MNGYLIAEEGPLAGLTVVFEETAEDKEWTLGRDPDGTDVVLEDPMVSRQHATVKATPEGFLFENLSSVNPATQNGMIIAEPVLLKEGDIIQIGSTFFHFSEKAPEVEPSAPAEEEEAPSEEPTGEMTSELHFGPTPDTRWLLKVISGPNAGAEFAMHKSSNYLIGKDPNICDVVFQDLSVSRQHARLSIDAEENAFIEDLGSRNGVIVNGELIDQKQLLSSQDLVALGTTTFLVIDRKEARETIISPAAAMPTVPKSIEEAKEKAKDRKDWKELIIPKRHLILAGTFALILLGSTFAMLSLFKSEPVVITKMDDKGKIEKILEKYPGVEFSFNEPSGKLFLTGNVLTTVDHQELTFLLRQESFIRNIKDNVVVDELVWQNMNALLSNNPDWIAVSMYGPKPGRFVLRGYVPTLEESEELSDFVNRNFDYLERLRNEVVIEKNMQKEIQSLLTQKGFSAVTFQMSNGEVVFTGRIDEKEKKNFYALLTDFKRIPGVQTMQNFVVVTSGDTSRVDVSSDFKVTGYSKGGDNEFFVVINGRILGSGDLLDGMMITAITPKMVSLEKEGVQYRINYNLQ